MSNRFSLFPFMLVLGLVVWGLCVADPASAGEFGFGTEMHVVVEAANLRAAPGRNADKVATLERNASVILLESRGAWLRVASVTNLQGWVRRDLVSERHLVLLLKERTMLLMCGEVAEAEISVRDCGGLVRPARYFARPDERGGFVLDRIPAEWRDLLSSGRITYAEYAGLVTGTRGNAPGGPARLSGTRCARGVEVLASPLARLRRLLPRGTRLDAYASEAEYLALNENGALGAAVQAGSEVQLCSPAAGVRPGWMLPHLAYPGGDIQPDFANSADVVVRAVRHAGLDLQALVHEDYLRFPDRYAGVHTGDMAAMHRNPEALRIWLKQHALSLPVDAGLDPLGFEPGDIVTLDSGLGPTRGTDRVGVVAETCNPAGVPLLVTVWDMGQNVGLRDVLGRRHPRTTGHFRLLHLFDYK